MNKNTYCTHCKGGLCEATTYSKCPVMCSFIATKADLVQGRKKRYERIRRLPKDTQKAIADKYYDGKMPWRW